MHPFMRQISVTYRCALRFREQELADTGLAGCQTPYLTALHRHPGLTQDELARHLNVNKSSVTRQVTVLEQQGYIRREADASDRRIQRVYLTEQAEALIGRIFRCYLDWNDYLTQDMTEEEQQMLSALMAKITHRADLYGKEAASCEPSGDI